MAGHIEYTCKYGYDTAITWRDWTASTSSTSESAGRWVCVDTSQTWIHWNVQTGRAYRIGSTQQTPRPVESQTAKEAAQAVKKSQDLLLSQLNETQAAMYKDKAKFHVIGADGVRYEIDCTKRMHNVFALDDKNERTEEFCIYQTGNTPLADNHLAQKLLLEHDVEAFRRIANRRRLRA